MPLFLYSVPFSVLHSVQNRIRADWPSPGAPRSPCSKKRRRFRGRGLEESPLRVFPSPLADAVGRARKLAFFRFRLKNGQFLLSKTNAIPAKLSQQWKNNSRPACKSDSMLLFWQRKNPPTKWVFPSRRGMANTPRFCLFLRQNTHIPPEMPETALPSILPPKRPNV